MFFINRNLSAMIPRMLIQSFISLFFFLTIGISGQTLEERILQVPNPRTNGGWVFDGIGYLTDSGAIQEINPILTELELKTSAEVAVVTLPSIGEESPKIFATSLFEKWGIGKKGKDNGVLLLHILDQRRVEIETGYGLEGVLPDVLCKRILENFIIPHFKAGEFSTGITRGSYAIGYAIEHPNSNLTEKLEIGDVNFVFADLPVEHYQALHQSEIPSIEDPPGIIKRHFREPANSFKEFFYFWFALIITSVWFSIGSILSILPFGNSLLYNIHAYFGRWISWFAGLFAFGYMVFQEANQSETYFSILNLVPIGASLFFINRWIGNSLRNNPRICPACKNKMSKLSEKADNAHLSPGEISEEKIFSVDYDIWKCNSCNTVTKEQYRGTNPASTCEKCHFKTYRNISVQVIREATYEHGGEELRNYECAHCHLFESKRVSTPKLQRSSSSSDGGSSSGGSSWSSGGSSGSWGGGSSGGGGSGSSY